MGHFAIDWDSSHLTICYCSIWKRETNLKFGWANYVSVTFEQTNKNLLLKLWPNLLLTKKSPQCFPPFNAIVIWQASAGPSSGTCGVFFFWFFLLWFVRALWKSCFWLSFQLIDFLSVYTKTENRWLCNPWKIENAFYSFLLWHDG